VYDWLPTGTSTVADLTRRFSYVSTSAINGLTGVVPTVNRPPTQAPHNAAATNPTLNNQEEIAWNFGAQTLAAGASVSITFVVQVGSALPLSPPSYDNYARASFSGGSVNSGTAATSVRLMANLSVTKTNGTNTLLAGSTTSYTVTFSNLGPSAAGGAVVKDAFSAGLSCTTVTCAATTGGASCPSNLALATPVAAGSTALFSTGETIATLPANSTVQLLVQCGVTANGQ
jgi:uncharacterized repeat protein (TIGR01451 family)